MMYVRFTIYEKYETGSRRVVGISHIYIMTRVNVSF